MAKLAIVVGHTSEKQGAWGAAPISQQEYTWNLDLADMMLAESKLIDGFESQVFLRNAGLREAYREALAWGADASMELHFNAYSDPRAHGSETLYQTDVSFNFARAVHGATLSVLGFKDRGVKKPANAGNRGEQNLKQMGTRPSILLEPFFGSNPNEARIAHKKKPELARAQVKAASKYLLTPFDNNDDREWRVLSETLHIRGGPGAQFATLEWGPLQRGDRVHLISRHGDWNFVQLGENNERRGFVFGSFLG